MEVDQYKEDGGLLVSTSQDLLTTDGETSTVLTSNKMTITSFAQINSSFVALVDYKNHCIKTMNRRNKRIRVLAGTCNTTGYTEYGVTKGQFFYPWGLELDVRNPGMLLVTDQYNQALVSVDINTGTLKTILKFGLKQPSGLRWDGVDLFVTNYYYFITKVSWSSNGTISNKIVVGSRTTPGDKIGKVNEAKLRSIYSIKEVADGLFLVADYGNRKLKLLDINKHFIGPVCFSGELDCETSSLLPFGPVSLLKIGREVYVGMYNDIYKLYGTVILYNTYTFKLYQNMI